MSINWGIIGCGAIADKCTARALKEARGSMLGAVVRRDLDKCRAFAEKWGVPRYYGAVDEILKDEEVNAVYVATPIYLHCEQTIAAAEAGKHILVEKPMAMTSAECEQMIGACEANRVKLMVCYYQRFNARHQKLQQMIADGLIGKPVAARIQFGQYYPDTEGAWRQIPEMGGGGAIMDTGSHCIDTLRALLGAEVLEVRALADTLVFNYSVEDTASILLKFDNGIHGVVTSYFTSPDVDHFSMNIVDVYGTRGRVVASPINAKNSEGFLKAYTQDEWTEHYFEQNTHVALLEAFVESIEEDRPSPVPGEEGLMGLRVIEAAYESAKTGKAVKVV
jgi:1,5-anhydro-D-fructose reductase (1,5-anhydro-D-mannitol-forming)